MKKQRTITTVLQVILFLVIALSVGALSFFVYKMGTFAVKFRNDVRQRQMHLLCQTDHQALLLACRDISNMYKDGELKKSHYQIRYDPDPQVDKFPKIILDVDPTYLEITNDGVVILELFGGLDHFGVYAYPEYFDGPFDDYEYGDRKLIDGLWYYDDGYYNNPEYDKTIEALLEKYGKE